MEQPPEIQFVNQQRSEAVESRIRERVGRLERIFERITSCHVFVEGPARDKRYRYDVRIEVRVPGKELVVNNEPGDVTAHGDVYIAVRDAFDAMERQLKRWKRQKQGEVKTHEPPLQGRVAELHPDRDYGRIESTDGRTVYFHRNSVVGNLFDRLGEGDTVELVVQEDESAQGPQASTVRRIGAMDYVPEPAPATRSG